MKVKVIKNAYYNDEYLKVGRIIDYKCKKGEQLPSWATLADGIETKKDKQQKAPDVKEPENTPNVEGEELTPASDGTTPAADEVNHGENAPEGDGEKEEADIIVAGDAGTFDANGNPEQQEFETPEQTSLEAEAYLELLINEGIEKNILIEDADKKSVKEQIEELEKALGRKKDNKQCV